MAQVLADRGDSAMLFRGDDGLDELTITTTSRLWLIADGQVRSDVVRLSDYDIATAEPSALRGGDATVNGRVVREVLDGARGPIRDAVLLNAAAAIAAFDQVTGSAAAALGHGLPIATQAVDSGAAAELLTNWVASSQQFAATLRR
jgi:anthranilate phosphoribosyltransferase